MKLNGLKEKHYYYKIAPKDTKMCLEVMFDFTFKNTFNQVSIFPKTGVILGEGW